MKHHRLPLPLLGLSLAIAAALANAANVSGTWACSLNLENGPQNVSQTFVVKQQGEKLTGNHSSPLGEHTLTGVVKGENIVFTVEGSKGGQSFKLSYTGKVESRTKMAGAVEHAKGPGTWTAIKK
jgi:hypothetical protein